MSYVLAGPGHLQQLFASVLVALVADARAGSEVGVAAEETEEAVHYSFRTAGFGLPEERFREALGGAGLPAPEGFAPLGRALAWLREWGGEAEAGSRVGEGIVLRLSFPRFG
jgi:hypothetical protein